MASVRSSCKDLLERISPGSPQDLLLRTCTGSCKDLWDRNLAGSPQEIAHLWEFTGKIPRPRTGTTAWCVPAQSTCTSTYQKRTCFLMREFSGKMPQTKIMQNFKQNSRGRVCAILQSRNALTWTSHKSQFLREFTGKKPEARWSTQWSHCLGKNRPQHRHSRCVQACEVEMHGGHLAKAKSSFM